LRLRVPLPFKVLVSYLLVVAVGAIPTLLYLSQELTQNLVQERVGELTRQVRQMGRVLKAAPPAERPALARTLSAAFPGRVSLIDGSGDVRFDSHADATTMDSHATRPEVVAALGKPHRDMIEGSIPEEGLGVARRVSATTGTETIYVAFAVPEPSGGRPMVLRASHNVEPIANVSSRTITFLRNSQAVAISIALGLSLLAAVVLVRPLARVRVAAEHIAAGDYGYRVAQLADDEIGDVGRSLEALGAELRRRLAQGGSGEAMLVQLVDALPTPVVIFEADGDVQAINGAARRLLDIQGPSAGRRIRDLIEEASYQEAVARAEEEGAPEDLTLGNNGDELRLRIHVLKRPGSAPLHVVLGADDAADSSLLPAADAVAPRALAAIFDDARAGADRKLKKAKIVLEVPDDVPDIDVAEAEGRLAKALQRAFEGCVPAFGGKKGTLCVDVRVEQSAVGLSLDASPRDEDIERMRPLLEPLGGSLDVEPGEVTLWMPRA
jgi:HAMP domain-containing protein